MSRGLGALQRRIKAMLTRAYALGAPLRFADIRAAALADQQRDAALFGGDVTDKLRPTRERALKRALKSLIDRGDVLILSGEGGPGDPYRYVTIEDLASTFKGEKVNDSVEAMQIVAEMAEAVAKMP